MAGSDLLFQTQAPRGTQPGVLSGPTFRMHQAGIKSLSQKGPGTISMRETVWFPQPGWGWD